MAKNPSTTDDLTLLPCPFCGCDAVFDEVDDEDSPDFGGHFVRCTRCLGSLGLQFANKEDPRPHLAEKWNRRDAVDRPEPSSLVDDEDANGFTPSDYAYTAELLRSTEAIRKAAASNNHNIILAALDQCAVAPAARNAILEEAAKVAEQIYGDSASWLDQEVGADIARRIRARATLADGDA